MAQYNTEKRKIIIMTRLSEDEKNIFESHRNKTELSQAEYIRKCVLNKSFRINKVQRNEIDTTDFKMLIGELGKIGSNINQIAKSLNEGWQKNNLNKTLKEELEELNELKESLVRCVEKYYGNY